MLGQLIIEGLVVGFCYSLIALAMVIIYKTSEVLNFAQGELAMVATFFAYAVISSYKVPFVPAFFLTIAFSFVLGAAIYYCFLKPAKDPTLLGLIIITLGAERLLYGIASWIWGPDPKPFPAPVSDTSVYKIGGVVVSHLNVLTVAVAASLVILLALFFRFTRLGVAMKATSQNANAAELMGIRTKRIFAFTWGLSAAIGAVAGMLMAPIYGLNVNMMMDPLLKGFAAAVLGGMTSLPGCVLGGCLLGVIENLVGGYVSTAFKSVVAFVVIVLVLCIRPSGILGKHYIKKV